ncbi:MAG: type IV toxin-antitoxin system AbiEi family antitoxin [Chitinophagaceae bacterium]
MKETEIIQTALYNLEETRNIKGKWEKADPKQNGDGELDLYLGLNDEWKKHFYIEVKRELRAHHLKQLEEKALIHQPFMVIAENIFPTLKQELRERKIAYLDAAGNIFVHNAQFYIWLDGNKYVNPATTVKNRAFTKTGLKVVFYFLIKGTAINETYQQIAVATDVAIGNMKNILDGLKEAGYILQLDEKRLEIVNKAALRDRWLTGYREVLQPSLLIGTYRISNREKLLNWHALPIEGNEIFWGGEPAAQMMTDHIRPEILTIYTDNEYYPFVDKWKLMPNKKGDVRIYRKFWKEFQQDNISLAPPLLVWADLQLTNDPRNLETAEIIYDKYLKHEFE